jgi:hypothetical protein
MPDPTGAAVTPRPRKHLMPAGHPLRPAATAASTARVQRWVLSVLSLTILLHFAGGLVVAAVMIKPPVTSSRIGLLVIAAVVGVVAVGSASVIHRRGALTWWLALGAAPALVGAYLCFLR